MKTMPRPNAGRHRTAGASLRLVAAREDAGEHGVYRLAGKAVVDWRVSVEQAVVEGGPEEVDRDFDVALLTTARSATASMLVAPSPRSSSSSKTACRIPAGLG
jgi:hypothetical protein